MANADYIITGEGGLTPYAELAAEIGAGDLTFAITAIQRVQETGDFEPGMAVLVGDEIMRLVTVALPNITVARGCADTVPAAHPANTAIWFFSETIASDNVGYVATETIAAKVLPFSPQNGPVPVSAAPPLDLTFNWRFFRPYPPGNVLMQGDPFWDRVFDFEDLDTEFTLTWAHRDRLGQADQLIDHTEPDIGPEAGTTYVVRVYDRDNVLVRTASGITGTSWVYDRLDAETEVPIGTGRIVLASVRDGLESLQSYTIRIRPSGGGLGESLGENLGG